MATAGPKVHPGKRKANPMLYKNGSPRLRTLNVNQLNGLLEKSSIKKVIAKIKREIARRT